MLFRRLPVDTFVLDEMRMVLFSNFPADPVPAAAEDETGAPLALDMGAFVADIKLGLFVTSLL